MLTFLLPGGAGSNILVCISLGSALYTGRMMRSGTCNIDSNEHRHDHLYTIIITEAQEDENL